MEQLSEFLHQEGIDPKALQNALKDYLHLLEELANEVGIYENPEQYIDIMGKANDVEAFGKLL